MAAALQRRKHMILQEKPGGRDRDRTCDPYHVNVAPSAERAENTALLAAPTVISGTKLLVCSRFQVQSCQRALRCFHPRCLPDPTPPGLVLTPRQGPICSHPRAHAGTGRLGASAPGLIRVSPMPLWSLCSTAFGERRNRRPDLPDGGPPLFRTAARIQGHARWLVLTRQEAVGKWGKATYSLVRTVAGAWVVGGIVEP
jgi:hypothetical protein